MSGFFELDDDGWSERIADAQTKPDALDIAQPGFTEGALSEIGRGALRGTAWMLDAANNVLPSGTVAPDIYTADDAGSYYEAQKIPAEQLREMTRDEQERIRAAALNFWTPDAKTVGTLGKVLGGFSEITTPLIAGLGNPSVLVATQTNKAGKELVDQGVDANTAGAAAAVEGLTTYAGFKLPFLGNRLATKMVTGAAGNLGLGAGATALEQQILASRGYNELAEHYDPLDPTARTVDLLTGLAFGGMAHAGARMLPSQRDAALGANNAKHWQQDTAPGIPETDAAAAAHNRAMETAFNQMMGGEPVSVETPAEGFRPRPERAAEVPEDLHEFEQNRADELAGAEARAAEQSARIEALVPRADIAAVADESIRNSLTPVFERAARVKGRFDSDVREIAREIGSPHEPMVPKTLKGVARTTEKAIADYGGDVTKVKDLVRATVVVDDLAQAARAVEAAIAKFGKPTKLRNGLDLKFESADGYRDVNMNFVIDGQPVELQVNLPEMLAAKEKGHKLYEERRTIEAETKKSGEVSPEQLARMNALDLEMQRGYAAAWKEALSRSNASSESGSPSSRGSRSDTGRPAGTSQARTVAPPSGVGTIETGTPSQSKNLGKLERSGSTDGILPEAGTESPVISSVNEILAQRDVMVPTGAVDADGNAVVRSGREIMAEQAQAIAKAENDAKGFAAAVSCFLTRGIDDAS